MKSLRVQGVLVQVDGSGVLIRGASGVGKSMAAANLLNRGDLFVSDDLLEISVGPDGKLMGRAVEKAPRIEIRGLGVFCADSLFPGKTIDSTPIDCVVDLERYDSVRDAGRVDPDIGKAIYADVEVPQTRIPIPSGYDPALLIELALRYLRSTGVMKS